MSCLAVVSLDQTTISRARLNARLCVEIRMQPHQQQTVITSPAVIQPTYVSQPYVTASVAHSYRDHQSAVIGIVLIVTGSLSIGFNIVDIAVGAAQYNRYSSHHYYYTYSVSDDSNGVAGHGIWCGIMVSIRK